MKKTYKYIGGMMLVAALSFTACSPEDFDSPIEPGIPLMAEMEQYVQVNVDQENNLVSFSFDKPGHYAYWSMPISDKRTDRSTLPKFEKSYNTAGDYTVEVRVGNANGLSDGTLTKTFHIDNTVMDTKLLGNVAGTESKTWYVASSVAAHLGCGEPGSDGSGWYTAQPNEKKDWGLYDDALTFTTDMQYTYDPGEGGTVYVNTGCSIFSEFNTNDGLDFMASVEPQTTSYELEMVGNDAYIVLPANTLFPYIPFDASYEDPRFRIIKHSSKEMILLMENDAITWRIVLSTEREEVFNGFKYDSEFNLWKTATVAEPTFFYAHTSDWTQYENPTYTLDGATYNFSLPYASDMQWQAQFAVSTDIATSAAIHYDFSIIINSSKDVKQATVKLTEDGNDDNYFFVDRVDLVAGQDYIFWKSDMPGIDASKIKIVLDFGGNPENTDITVSNIVLKDHANDDGTKLPEEGGNTEGGANWGDVNSADNLLQAYLTKAPNFWFGDASWQTLPDYHEYSLVDGKHSITILGETVNEQWHSQVNWSEANIVTTSSKNYDFRVKILSDQDIAQATVKLCDPADNDAIAFFTDRIDLVAGEEYVFEKVNMAGIESSNVKLVFDFSGNPAGTNIQIYEMMLQEHTASSAGGSTSTLDPDAETNMWNSTTWEMHYYYAPDWAPIDNPEMTEDGNAYTVVLPTATSAQWQAQMAFLTYMTTNASSKYDFGCKITANQDLSGVTVKLVKNGDDGNYYFEDRVDLTAGEEYVFERLGMAGIDMERVSLFFDFGGNPAGTEVTISDVVFQTAN